MPLWIVLAAGASILISAGLIWALWKLNLQLTPPHERPEGTNET